VSGAVREWWDYAACVGKWSTFFGPEGEYRFAHEKREAEAKAICATCPVVAPCAAAGARQVFGVWGGAGEAERMAVRRSLPGTPLVLVAARPGETKYCPHCAEDRPVGEFGKAAGRPDGLTPLCRVHTNAYQRGRKAIRAAALITDTEVTLSERFAVA
jgi:WhiB family redox-sensing transcriptional regulator